MSIGVLFNFFDIFKSIITIYLNLYGAAYSYSRIICNQDSDTGRSLARSSFRWLQFVRTRSTNKNAAPWGGIAVCAQRQSG